MTRDEWCAAFVDELRRLRPHLAPDSKIAWAIAANCHDEKVDPKVAARRYDATQRPKA